MPFGGSSRPNYVKLRTNLRLVINRLKLLEKKKTELALKSRREIADYIQAGKDDRARIRVEHIIREDYMVEAMEIIEMFCDLLLARFGIIDKMKEMDPALEEPIATILWAAPRLVSDVPELNEVSKQLTVKYGKEFAEASRTNKLEMVNEKVLVKMGVAAPPKKLIEQYMIEIAKSFNVPFEPDPSAMMDEQIPDVATLIDLGFDPNKPGGGAGGGGGGGGMPAGMVDTMPPGIGFQPPPAGFHPPQQPNAVQHAPAFTLPPPPQMPGQFSTGPPPLPSQPPNAGGGSAPPQLPSVPPAGAVPPGLYPQQNGNTTARLPSYDEVLDDDAKKPGLNGVQNEVSSPSAPPEGSPPGVARPPVGGVGVLPTAGGAFPPAPGGAPAPGGPGGLLPPAPNADPTLPSVPTDDIGGASTTDDIDFDDLTKRFEELKKKK